MIALRLAAQVRPVVLARERRLAVPGPVGDLLPGGGLQRGTVVAVDGPPGAGGASVVMALVASATVVGEWAAVLDTSGTFGAVAAAEAGVALERLAVVGGPGVRGVPDGFGGHPRAPGKALAPGQFGSVVATLLDGVTVVAAPVPARLRAVDARRLVARARERGSVLVAAGAWPGEAALRLCVEGSSWSGLGRGEGLIGGRSLRVTLAGRGAAARSRTADVPTRGPGGVPLIIRGPGGVPLIIRAAS